MPRKAPNAEQPMSAQHFATNPAKSRASFMVWRDTKKADRTKQWRTENPIRVRMNGVNRRARLRGATKNIPVEQLMARWAEYGGRCAYHTDSATEATGMDHVIPIFLWKLIDPDNGPTKAHRIENILPACQHCQNARTAWIKGQLRAGHVNLVKLQQQLGGQR